MDHVDRSLTLLLLATACGQEDGGGNRAGTSGNTTGLVAGIAEQRQAAATLTLAASDSAFSVAALQYLPKFCEPLQPR